MVGLGISWTINRMTLTHQPIQTTDPAPLSAPRSVGVSWFRGSENPPRVGWSKVHMGLPQWLEDKYVYMYNIIIILMPYGSLWYRNINPPVLVCFFGCWTFNFGKILRRTIFVSKKTNNTGNLYRNIFSHLTGFNGSFLSSRYASIIFVPTWKSLKPDSVKGSWNKSLLSPLYTWNPNDPCFGWKGPCFGGLTFKNRGHWGSR